MSNETNLKDRISSRWESNAAARASLQAAVVSLLVAILSLLVGTSSALAQSTGYSAVMPLGPQRPSGLVHAYDINDARDVVGRGQKGFRWRPGTMLNTSGLLAPARPWSETSAVNNSGSAVGIAAAQDSNGQWYGEPYLWTPSGGYASLGTLTSDRSGIARGINDKGELIVHDRIASYFRGANANVTRLPDLGGGVTFALGINSAATTQVVGASKQSSGLFVPFVWSPDLGMAALPAPAGQQGFALAINSSGVAVGWVGDAPQIPWTDFSFIGDRTLSEGPIATNVDPWTMSYLEPLSGRPALWMAGRLVELPLLPGYTRGVAYAINDAGEVVGTLIDDNRNRRAFYFNPTAGMQWLDQHFLVYTGGGGPSRQYHVATGINRYGEVAAFGFEDGQPRAFVLVPPARAADMTTSFVNLFVESTTPRPAGTGLAVGDAVRYRLNAYVNRAVPSAGAPPLAVRATLRVLLSRKTTLASIPAGCSMSGLWLVCRQSLNVSDNAFGPAISMAFDTTVAKSGRLIARAEVTLDKSIVEATYSKIYHSVNAYPVRETLPRYRMVDLGFQTAAEGAHAYAINNAREIVGRGTDARSFIWRRGAISSLDSEWCTPGELCGGDWYETASIGDGGWVVGVRGVQADTQGFVWKPGMSRAAALQPFNGLQPSYAHAVNAVGTAAGFYRNAAGVDVAAVWPVGGLRIDLGTFGGRRSYALGINKFGKTTGAAEAIDGRLHAFIWNGSLKTDLGMLQGKSTVPMSINDNDVLAGWYGAEPQRTNFSIRGPVPSAGPSGWYYFNKLMGHESLDFATGAFVYKNGKFRDLGPGMAYDVNKSGLVVGYFTDPGVWSRRWNEERGADAVYGNPPARHAFLYDTSRNRSYDLSDLAVYPNGTPVIDWKFFAATSVNDTGDIVGWAGRLQNGEIIETKPFLLVPDREPLRDLAVSLTQTPSAGSRVGDTLSYGVSVANVGNEAVTAVLDVAIDWRIVTAISLPSGCAQMATSIHCDMGALASNTTQPLLIQLRPISSGYFSFQPRVSTTVFESNWANNRAAYGHTILG